MSFICSHCVGNSCALDVYSIVGMFVCFQSIYWLLEYVLFIVLFVCFQSIYYLYSIVWLFVFRLLIEYWGITFGYFQSIYWLLEYVLFIVLFVCFQSIFWILEYLLSL